jgi:hypothetical protein
LKPNKRKSGKGNKGKNAGGRDDLCFCTPLIVILKGSGKQLPQKISEAPSTAVSQRLVRLKAGLALKPTSREG